MKFPVCIFTIILVFISCNKIGIRRDFYCKNPTKKTFGLEASRVAGYLLEKNIKI